MNQTTFGGALRQHAALISGGNAEQRSAFALRLAAARLCAAGGDEACGRCIHCRKTAEGIHPDLTRILPDNGQIKVDAIRAMRTDAFTLPNDAAVRVFLIEDADLMNDRAQNAALKILEEPPSHAVFLLTTALPDTLLPTVRSRCAPVRLPSVPEADPSERARRLTGILVRRDRLELALYCRELESLPREQLPPLLQDLCALFSEALRCKMTSAPAGAAAAELARRFSAKTLVALIRALDPVQHYYENNGSRGHLAGLLNVNCWEAIHD